MVKERCRLCFAEKSRPIGIFTEKGIKLKIGELIQRHFREEISENDIFPNFVCISCWTKLLNFHEFCNCVDEAKSIFLKNILKEEVPNFTEIICDAVEYDEEFVPVKHELVDDGTVKEAEPVLPENQAQDSEDSVQGDAEHDSKPSDHFDLDTNTLDDTCSESDEGKLNVNRKRKMSVNETLTAPIAAELAEEISECTESKKKTRKKAFDELVSKYMNMNCELCNHPFETLPEARAHYRSTHGQRDVIINCCDRRLRVSNIRDHLRYHMDPDIFKCKICYKRFVIGSHLKSHMQKHLPKVFECDICKKKFTTRDNIRAHILGTHSSGRAQNDCHICTKRFATKAGLQQHVKNVHERIGEVVCHICAKVYNSKVNLRMHLLDHSDVPPPRVCCEICGSTFKSERNRIRHVRRHQETGVPCPHCQKISPNRNALKSHIVSVHSKPMLQCHLCDKKFKRTLALTEHVATHTGEDLYNCAYCPQKFKYHSSLYLHYRGVHPVEWNADRQTKEGRQKKAEKFWHP